jgi:hypothetical protein
VAGAVGAGGDPVDPVPHNPARWTSPLYWERFSASWAEYLYVYRNRPDWPYPAHVPLP